MSYVIIGYFIIVFILIAYRFYDSYMKSERFNGEGFYKNPTIQKLILKFKPADEFAEVGLRNQMFTLGKDFTLEAFILIRGIFMIVMLLLSIVISNTVLVDHNKNIYTKERDIPFTITKEEYLTLTTDISFDSLNKYQEINQINANALKLQSYDKVTSISGNLLYNTLEEMHKEVNSKLIYLLCTAIVVAMGLVGLILPVKVKDFFIKSIRAIEFEEYVMLENLVYVNTDSNVEDVLEMICEHSVRYYSIFAVFKERYEFETRKAFESVLKDSQLPMNATKILEYLYLMEKGETENVRRRIEVISENNFDKLERVRNIQMKKRKSRLTTNAMITIIIFLLSAMVDLIDLELILSFLK